MGLFRSRPELICRRFGIGLPAIMAVGTEPSGAIGANHAALLLSNPERPLFRLCRPGVGICRSRFGLEGDDKRLRRHGRRHRPQAPGKSEWNMELLDEAKEPVFRIRITSE